MFELGIRLAFDKPTIIIKDDKTNYIFDTSLIDHLEYPHDLHYQSILKFKEKLSAKIEATYKKSIDPKYSSFLKNFGDFTISKIDKKEVSESQYIIKAIQELKNEIRGIKPVIYEKIDENESAADTVERLWSKYRETFAIAKKTKMTDTIFEQFKIWTLENGTRSERQKIRDVKPTNVIQFVNDVLSS